MKLAELKEKEKEKYKRKREKGVLSAKLVKSMGDREHRKIKKEWKKRSKTYREKKKKQKRIEQLLNGNSPPPSPASLVNDGEEINNTPASTSRKHVGRKRVQKSRSKMFRMITELKHKVCILKKSAEKYKKRFQRVKKKLEEKKGPLTPNSKVDQFLNKEKVSEGVKRKLVFGEVIERQLKENFQNITQHKNKRIYNRNPQYNLLKKYRLLDSARKAKILNPKSLKVCQNKMQPRGRYLSKNVKEDVCKFF